MALGDNVSLAIAVGATNCPVTPGAAYALSAHYGNPQPLDGLLAKGSSIYVLESLRWIETGGDQSTLMGNTISLTGTLIGRTP
jgi:hypothetical protein